MEHHTTSNLARFIDRTDLTKFIVFPIAPYHFALPIAHVLRVVNYPALTRTSLDGLGLIRIDRRLIKIIDLQRQLQVENTALPEQRSLLVIMRISSGDNLPGDLYGIPVLQPPDLLEISPAQVQRLPEPTAYSSLPERLSSAVVLPQQEPILAIFLLDLNRVLNR